MRAVFCNANIEALHCNANTERGSASILSLEAEPLEFHSQPETGNEKETRKDWERERTTNH